MKAADLFVNYVCTMPRMLTGVVNSEISTAPTTTASQYLTPYVPETHYSSGNESTGQKGKKLLTGNKLFRRGNALVVVSCSLRFFPTVSKLTEKEGLLTPKLSLQLK